MGIFDLFRPRWRHSNPEVRAEAVRQLASREVESLTAVARHDHDPLVRRLALKKLDDRVFLREVAASDPDEGVRSLAASKAIELAIDAACASCAGGEPADALRALAELGEVRDVAAVARRASEPAVWRAAIARLDDRLLLDLARHAEQVDTRVEAIARVKDAAALAELALGDETRTVALAALGRISDPATLASVARDARCKAARAAARELLPEEKKPEGRAPGMSAAEQKDRRARLLHLCLAAEAAVRGNHLDKAAAALDRLRGEWEAIGTGAGDESLRRRFEQPWLELRARREASQRPQPARATDSSRRQAPRTAQPVETKAMPSLAPVEQAVVASRPAPVKRAIEMAPMVASRAAAVTVAERLAELCAHAEGLRGSERGIDGRLAELEQRWQELMPAASRDGDQAKGEGRGERRGQGEGGSDGAPADSASDPAIEQARLRFAAARARILAEGDAERGRRQARRDEALLALERACVQLEESLTTDDLKVAEGALRSAQATGNRLRGGGDQRDAALRVRLAAAQERLSARIRELREVERWKRWANVPKLEELCSQAEALVEVLETVEDKRRAPAVLRELQIQWRAVGPVPAEKAQPLWERFQKAAEQVREGCREFMAKLDEERGSNLTRKQELCARAEELATSSDWRESALQIKKLQQEWKEIGPVPQEQAQEVWKRFRAACDTFFGRRAQQNQERQEEWLRNLGRKQELCVRVEALAGSTDWKETTRAIRACQEEWKAIGPVPREESDAVWRRFRAACDRFFEARRVALGEQDSERAANLARKLALCEQAEELAGALDREAAMARAKGLQREWKAIGPVPREQSDAIWKRFRAACDVAFSEPEVTSAEVLTAADHGFSNRLPLEGLVAGLAAAEGGSGAEAGEPSAESAGGATGEAPPESAGKVTGESRGEVAEVEMAEDARGVAVDGGSRAED